MLSAIASAFIFAISMVFVRLSCTLCRNDSIESTAPFSDRLKCVPKIKAEAIALSIKQPLADRLPEYQAIATKYHTTIDVVMKAAGVTARDRATAMATDMNQAFASGVGPFSRTAERYAALPAAALAAQTSSAYGAALALGGSLGAGLLVALAAKQQLVQTAAAAVGAAAVSGLNAHIRAQSPSKASTYLGEMLGDGLIVGMESKSLVVQNAGRIMGRRAVEATAASVGAGIPTDLSRGASQLGGAAQGMAAAGPGGRLSSAPQQNITVNLNGSNMTPAAVATEVAWQMKTRAA